MKCQEAVTILLCPDLENESQSRKKLSLNQKNKGAAAIEKPLFVDQGCLEMSKVCIAHNHLYQETYCTIWQNEVETYKDSLVK